MSLKKRITQYQATRNRRQTVKENAEIKRLTILRDKATASAARATEKARLQAEIAAANQKKLAARGRTGGSGALKFLGQQFKSAGKQLAGDLKTAARNVAENQRREFDREFGSRRGTTCTRTTSTRRGR